jgi:hypothetical protein
MSDAGPRQRHLARRAGNPLFGARSAVTEAERRSAQQADAAERAAFQRDLQALLEEAAKLGGRVDSEVILELKERADALYQQACTVEGDTRGEREGLVRLLQVLMRAVWAGAENDPQARWELEQEESARALHMELLEHPLVCDLLMEESPIPPEELPAALLSEPAEAVEAAAGLFDPPQLAELAERAGALLAGAGREDGMPEGARAALLIIKGRAGR